MVRGPWELRGSRGEDQAHGKEKAGLVPAPRFLLTNLFQKRPGPAVPAPLHDRAERGGTPARQHPGGLPAASHAAFHARLVASLVCPSRPPRRSELTLGLWGDDVPGGRVPTQKWSAPCSCLTAPFCAQPPQELTDGRSAFKQRLQPRGRWADLPSQPRCLVSAGHLILHARMCDASALSAPRWQLYRLGLTLR